MIGELLGPALGLVLLFAAVYYGVRLLRRAGKVLLWRVRRRLMITYLFVGLTPILLLGLLGLIAGFGVSAEAMARIVTAQINLLTREAAGIAGALAQEAPGRLQGADDGRRRAWLEERARLAQAVLPGARVSLWCCGTQPPETALPAWARSRREWQGVVYDPSPTEAPGGAARVRALARGAGASGSFTILLDAPLGPDLLERLRESTGIGLRPLDAAFDPDAEGSQIAVGDDGEVSWEHPLIPQKGAAARAGAGKEASTRLPYLVVLRLTRWVSGEAEERPLFAFDWSWEGAIRQILGSSLVGSVWQYGLAAVAVLFLILELVAIVAAVWMTRAVTGTVHELHRATERIQEGDFSFRARIGSRDQLGDLAEAFNDMSANIESLLQERVRRERLEREVEIAAEVQSRLFPPKPPSLGTVSLAGSCRAARGVAGDYYDYVELGGGRVLLALGDVSGKGISASLLMSNLQASLRALASAAVGNGLAPGVDGELVAGGVAGIVTAVNRQLCRSTDVNRFATLFLALYDDAERTVRYTSAGHGAAILVRPGGAVERLERGGTVVGAFEEARYEEAAATLEPGALLVLFSDGLSEAHNPAGEEFGEQRLVHSAVQHRARTADEVLQGIFAAVEAWAEGEDRSDDQTLVVAKAHPA